MKELFNLGVITCIALLIIACSSSNQGQAEKVLTRRKRSTEKPVKAEN